VTISPAPTTSTAPTTRRLALATGLTYQLREWATAATDLTIVLVHGFLDLGAAWDEVAAALAPRAHVVAPDLRGHGDSDRVGPGGYYHFPDYVADLDDVIAQVARRELIVVGHSMGGSVAGYWAGVRPRRPRALALLEGLGPPDTDVHPAVPDPPEPAAGAAGVDLAARTAAWIDAWRAARATPGRVLASLDDTIARLRRHDPRLTDDRARHLAEAGTRVDADGQRRWKHDPLHLTTGPYPFRLAVAARYWRRVECPVLCVDGDASTLNLAEAERARRRACFADVRHEVVADAGHMLQRHQPAAIAALLLGLVDATAR
jgi:pimeloyl-ACP methyl ester carboxylesterase